MIFLMKIEVTVSDNVEVTVSNDVEVTVSDDVEVTFSNSSGQPTNHEGPSYSDFIFTHIIAFLATLVAN